MKKSIIIRLNSLLIALFLTVQIYALPVNIITIGDLHGGIAPTYYNDIARGGVEQLYYTMQNKENYNNDDFLFFVAGDNVTGQTISNAFNGLSTIEILNAMGADVSSVGNHEFDFGYDAANAMMETADFPFISANIVPKNDNAIHFEPYVIIEQNGVKVGVISLMTYEFKYNANASVDYIVKDFLPVIKDNYQKVKAKGADVVILLTHTEADVMKELAPKFKDMNIPLIICAHTHEVSCSYAGETFVVASGTEAQHYSRITIDYDEKTKKANVEYIVQERIARSAYQDAPINDLTTIINKWSEKLDVEYSKVIAYSDKMIFKEPDGYKMFTKALYESSGADIAVTNYGSIRADIPAGNITYSHIITIMPFLNLLVNVSISGEDLIKNLNKDPYFYGAEKVGDDYILLSGGKIEKNKTYLVVTSDYYAAGAKWNELDSYIEVLPDWREPVVNWLINQNTSIDNPLSLD